MLAIYEYWGASSGAWQGETALRYLVTGGAGFIGSHLVDALIARGDEVVVLDDLSTGRLENIQHLVDSGHIEFVEGSVLDQALVDDCVRRVDRCYHLASAVGVKLVVERPLDTLLANVNGMQNVMLAAARYGRWLLYTSTSEVYGKQNGTELHENSDRIFGSPLKSRSTSDQLSSLSAAPKLCALTCRSSPCVRLISRSAVFSGASRLEPI